MNQVKVDSKFQGAVLKISHYVVQPLTTQIDFSSFVMFGLTLFSFLATSSTLHQEWPVDEKVSLLHVLNLNYLTTPIDTLDIHVLQESPGAASTQTVSIVIDREHLRQVETLLWQLGQPPLVPTGVNLPRSEPQDGHNEPSEMQDLTDTFMCLSMSNNPASSTAALLWARTPPSSLAARLSPRKGTKYYAIIIGKCTGVYYGEWYTNI